MHFSHMFRVLAVGTAMAGGSIFTVGVVTAGVASADATHVNDCSSTAFVITAPCGFSFFYGNGSATTTFQATKYKDTASGSGNETEVFIGNATANEVPNPTDLVVTYSAANNPNGPGQTCLSFVSGNTTLNWTMTIQPDGEWNLTCNFKN